MAPLTADQLTVVSESVKEQTYFSIYEINGRELLKIKIESTSQLVSLSELPNGIYLYKFWKENELLDIGKISINK